MSLGDYVRYENEIKRPFRGCPRKTTKEEWTERFEFVYKSSAEYVALNKPVDDAYMNYRVYRNRNEYTSDKDTTSTMQTHLYSLYYHEMEKQESLKKTLLTAFTERFPAIKQGSVELEHYLHCCELYATHRLKGIEYSLPFSVVASPVPVASPVENEFEVVADKPPSKPVGTWDDLKVVRTKSKPLVIKEKRPHPKKHTLSILLTQEKEKTRKLQDILKQTISEDQVRVMV
jgi:hypothetical protein